MTAAYNYFHVTNFFWMFGEGCYLHTAIVLTYSTDRLRKWMFVCIGWGECAPPAGPSPTPHPHSGQLARGPASPGPGPRGGVSTTALCPCLGVGCCKLVACYELYTGERLPTSRPWPHKGPLGLASPRPH